MDKEAIIVRFPSTEKQTLGRLFHSTGTELFECKTLERPWLDNAPNVSCIPKGKYVCRYTLSPKFSLLAEKKYLKENGTPSPTRIQIYTYEIMDVPGRSGVRMHALTYYYQSEGCIGLGSDLKDLNADQNFDLIHTGDTMRQFEALMNKEDFNLIIY